MWHQLPLMRERFGDEGARAVASAAASAVDGIGRFCEENGVDAWYRRGGYLQVSTRRPRTALGGRRSAACGELGGG